MFMDQSIGMFVISLLALVGLAIDWMTRGVPFPGFGTIVALMVMFFGILFCFLGVVSIYIGLIYEEVKRRPNFIIREALGFREEPGTISPIGQQVGDLPASRAGGGLK